jgi:hypothetical protein
MSSLMTDARLRRNRQSNRAVKGFALKKCFMNTTETRSTSTPRVKAFRRRQSWGLHRRAIDVTDAQLDALEARGYLHPCRRGDRADECDAIEMFLVASLNKR